MAEEKKLLNYKYEIFPTAPQRFQLNRILRQGRIQWNRAVTIRKKLKTALRSGQIEHVIESCLSTGKSDTQAKRKNAILKFQSGNPALVSLDFDSAARLYDIKNLVGKLMNIEPAHLDIKKLASELKSKHDAEISDRNLAKAKGVDQKKLPKLTVYWKLIGAINTYAGYAAKTYMDESLEVLGGNNKPKMSLAVVRFNISGSANSEKWNTACNPSKEQRAYGALGDPRYKRRCDGFAFQVQNTDTGELVLERRKSGHVIEIKALPKGMRQVPIAYHRPIPDGANIKSFTVNSKAGRFFAVLSCEVPDSAWKIAPMDAGWRAGIDPGASTALTVALINKNSGKAAHFAAHWEFLERSAQKLEKLQQGLAHKNGPTRERTETEIQDRLKAFTAKSQIKKLPDEERGKLIAKEEKWLKSTKVRNAEGMSKRWRRWARRVAELNLKIANQRADVHHKLSRALAEGCDVVGLGNWEPVREVSYRKKLRVAKKKVKQGIAGATDELKALEDEKSKQGPKGAKKQRRSGRDRGIASLRSLIDEKAGRAGTVALPRVKEAYSTMTCCVCGAQTGPKQDPSIRQWRCSECNTKHHRDLNSGFNILMKTEQIIASAQEAELATAPDATRTNAQGATGQKGRKPGLRATGHSGRGGSFFYENNGSLPPLWDKEVPKSLKSLIDMGIVRSLSMQTGPESGMGTPL